MHGVSRDLWPSWLQPLRGFSAIWKENCSTVGRTLLLPLDSAAQTGIFFPLGEEKLLTWDEPGKGLSALAAGVWRGQSCWDEGPPAALDCCSGLAARPPRY